MLKYPRRLTKGDSIMITLIHATEKYKKKNFDIYKELLKETSKTMKNIPLEDIIQIDTFFNHDIYSDISKLALLFYSHKDGSGFSKLKKEIKRLYKEHGLKSFVDLYLYFTYALMERDHILNEYGIEIANKYTRYSVQDSIYTYFNIESIIANLSLIIIIMENDLLNYGISHFEENNGEFKLIRNIKRDNISIIKSCYNKSDKFEYGVIGLISSKELDSYLNKTAQIVKSYSHLGSNKAGILCSDDFLKLKNLTSVNFYQTLLSKMIYLKSYFNISENPFENSLDLEVCYLKCSLLKSRKFLPPRGGVVLKINNHEHIESIYLNEGEFHEDRFLTAIVRYKDKSEYVFSLILPVNLFHIIALKHVEDVIDILLDFYGIEDENKPNNNLDYEVLSPYYWKYRNNNYETKNEKETRVSGKKVKREHEIKISSFIRKINGNPSNEALTLAKRLCIELEPNTTVVKEHTRTYSKNID